MNAQRMAEVRNAFADLRRALAEEDAAASEVWRCRCCNKEFGDWYSARGHERRVPGHVVDLNGKG